jgi:hypothetical protein
MARQKESSVNQPKKTKYIIKETYCGTKSSQEIFTDIFISENEKSGNKIWTAEQNNDIIKETDNSLISCCSRKE